jgi:nocturnin
LRLRRRTGGGGELLVATTHLKARGGADMAAFRREQGRDLTAFLAHLVGDESCVPLIITGDFNAEPSEPVIQSLTSQDAPLHLTSAYR